MVKVMNTSAESIKAMTDVLLNILEEELWTLLELTDLSQDKIAMLVKSDIDGLENMLSSEEEAIDKLHKKENERVKLISQLASVLGITPEECRLKTLLEYLDDESARQKLGDIRQRLQFAARKMARSNQKAEALAIQKAKYTDLLINILYNNTNQNRAELYDGQGKVNSKADYGRLDYKV